MSKLDLKHYLRHEDRLNNVQYNSQLVTLFPFMLPQSIWETEIYDGTWTYFDDIPIGWRKAFGWEMACELRDAAEADKLEDFYVIQIKEKFGELRFYTSETSEKVEAIIRKYEDLSRKTCVECGKPAKFISTGWICPWCEDCIKKVHDQFVPISMGIE